MLCNSYVFLKGSCLSICRYYFNLSDRNRLFHLLLFVMTLFIAYSGITCSKSPAQNPLRVVIDLNIGESQEVKLINGEIVNIKLLDIDEIRDDLRLAIRAAFVRVAVDGQEITLNSANYNLPVTVANVQIDCPITGSYYKNSNSDAWGLEKDARFRLWPAGSPFIVPGTFVYPVKQRWFASDTQMSNEPCYVDWGEDPSQKSIYYHNGLDFGGSEELVEVVSATDGLVVSAGEERLPGYENTPVRPRYDVIYIVDEQGWYYRYSHLYSIDSSVHPGVKVKMGQKIGMLGKEGGSGGWTHLHFDIRCRQPSGKWGTEEGYAYIWESYVHQYNPPLIAVARPHHLVFTGQTVTLNGGKSRSIAGEIITYEWTFSDGSTSSGPIQQRTYNLPGTYSEVLKIVDSKGNVDYDFAVVQVRDKINPDQMPPSIHANYYPTFDIKPGDPVTFKVRTFRIEVGNEIWDFGDGTPPVTVKSFVERSAPIKGKYAETVHRFSQPGHYIVQVERSNKYGYKATAHLHVEVLHPDTRQ